MAIDKCGKRSALVWRFLLLILFCNNEIKAQFVTIPDTGVVTYMKRFHGACITGNQLDTTCPGILNAKYVSFNFGPVKDITGVQYFKSLRTLYCSGQVLYHLPPLPKTLRSLECNGCFLADLPVLPDSLEELLCHFNNLTSLPQLPATIRTMMIGKNWLKNLPVLPDSLVYMDCTDNLLELLPAIPPKVRELRINNNKLDSLPLLPNLLERFSCDNNNLKSLPSLPPMLSYFGCGFNQIATIPALPASLRALDCNHNLLTQLPELPEKLYHLWCQNNQLTSLPEFPKDLIHLICSDNKILCFPVFPENSWDSIENNPFTCVPNYVKWSPRLLLFPLCQEGDKVNNPNNCPEAVGLRGIAYHDKNNNCVHDSTENLLSNLPIVLRDSNGIFLSKQLSLNDGSYNFIRYKGKYSIGLDTSGLPLEINCVPGNDSTFRLDPSNPMGALDFGFTLKSGFDLGVSSVNRFGAIFPGRMFNLRIIAGDMTQKFGLTGAGGIGGRVDISVSGKVKYRGVWDTFALAPTSVNGNNFSYTITDFGKIDNDRAFILLFSTDTNAQMTDSVCVDVAITPLSGDNNNNNNSKKICFGVSNSFDPNMKEVYPADVPEKYNDWLTYTVHFQNTGNAPAYDIKIRDTLDQNLDAETFEVLASSHPMTASLSAGSIIFKFKDIMLPDSHSNNAGSNGFVQYRVKPKADLPAGTKISNTAYIYFDYNAAVVTNTTLNRYQSPVASLNRKLTASGIRTYPNPTRGKVFISSEDQFSLSVTDITGRIILQKENAKEIDLPAGLFFFEYLVKGEKYIAKVVVY